MIGKKNNVFLFFIKLTIKLILFAIIIILPILTFAYFSKIEEIDVIGTNIYKKDEVINSLIESEADNSAVFLYLKYKYFKKPQLPFIDKIDFELVNMNKINIYLYDKVLTGAIEYMGEFMYFDKEGVIIESANERYEEIPIIKGLALKKVILNEQLQVSKEDMFQIILNITKQISYNKIDVDIIEFNNQYEVKLYCSDNIILLGKEENYDEKLAELASILKEDISNYTINIKDINNIRAKVNK